MAQILVDAKASVDPTDEDDNTPLMLAARYGKVGAVKVLIAAFASLTLANKASHTAADTARHAGSRVIEELLVDAALDRDM